MTVMSMWHQDLRQLLALHSVKMSLETRSELLAKWLECFLFSGVSVCDFVRKVNYH